MVYILFKFEDVFALHPIVGYPWSISIFGLSPSSSMGSPRIVTAYSNWPCFTNGRILQVILRFYRTRPAALRCRAPIRSLSGYPADVRDVTGLNQLKVKKMVMYKESVESDL